ncbi:MAG: right-handed parallel beta-helix repeat-containing protein [Thermoplasmata archaeon]|nr:right-handed parallel beta-helix repeat-containing protein [Thermoplasmata archaeon]
MKSGSKITKDPGLRDARIRSCGLPNGLRNGFTGGRDSGRGEKIKGMQGRSRIPAILGLALVVLCAVAGFTWQSTIAGGINTGEKMKAIPHPQIHINGNADFAVQAAANGWEGNGSQENPYIIENYEIDGQGSSYCIWIENTDVHFVIRNCYVWNAVTSSSPPYGGGLALNNVRNGNLNSNECNGSKYGIYLYGSSKSNTVTANFAFANDYGIYLKSSSNNILGNNNVAYNSYYGIYLYDSTGNTLTNNSVTDNYNGIFLSASSNNTLTGNNASDNTNHGISSFSSNWNILIGNSAFGNYWYGIYLYSSSRHNTVAANNISGNYFGIHLYSATNNTLTGNNVSGNIQYGIYLYSSSNNTMTYNWLCNNTKHGIYIETSSAGNSIHHNNFFGNNGTSRGSIDGKSQAYDSTGSNYWYEPATSEGNYWSNWDGNGWGTSGAYPIAGGAGASDWYPLTSPAVREDSPRPLALLVLPCCLAFAWLYRKNNNSIFTV